MFENRERERENFELSGLWHRSLSNELHLESSRGQGESLLREKVTRLTFQVYAGLRTALWISRASISPWSPLHACLSILQRESFPLPSIPLRCKWALRSFDENLASGEERFPPGGKRTGRRMVISADGTMTKDDLVIRECPRWRLYDEERRIIVSNLVASLNCFEQFLREIKHRPSSFRGNEKFELPIRVSNSLFHPCSETHGIYRSNQISCPDIFLPSIHLRILCANTTGW